MSAIRSAILILAAALLPFVMTAQQIEENMRLVYVYDPLCGWCYGFSPVIADFASAHAGEFDVEVISGGMVTGERVGPIGETAAYIGDAYKVVEERTGVKFGEAFLQGTLKEGKAIFTSLPGSVAMCIFKRIKPKEVLEFAARMQKAVYFEGMAPDDQQGFARLASEFGLDEEDFLRSMKDPQFEKYAREEFSISSQLGVTGFPTVLFQRGEKLYVMARGYVDRSVLDAAFEKLMATAE